MATYIKIEPDMTVSLIELDGSLESYQNAVGGYIEAIYPVNKLSQPIAFFGDEEARLKPNAQVNYFATALFGYERYGGIVGDVIVIAAGTDEEGNTLPPSDEVIEGVRQSGRSYLASLLA